MASAATILSQGVPALLNAFPGWKTPVHLRVKATVSGGVVTPVAADTTPGVAIADTGGAGTYTLTFPPCRRLSAPVGNVSPVTPAAATNHRHVTFAASTNAAAAAGSVAFFTIDLSATPAPLDPEAGSTVEISFWADLG